MNKFKNAPNIKIPSTNGETFELKKIKNKFLVLYFYPKDDTPGCTIETKDFNSLLSKFNKLDCAVFGISKDDMKSHDKFKEKYKVKFDLLSDEKKEALKAKYSVKPPVSKPKFSNIAVPVGKPPQTRKPQTLKNVRTESQTFTKKERPGRDKKETVKVNVVN